MLLVLSLVLLTAPAASAQLSPQMFNQNLSIDLRPTSPEPGETVTASLNDYSLGLSVAGMRWFVDGEEVAEARNERSVEFTVGAYGEETSVRAVVESNNGFMVEASRTIIPATVDIIIEPRTFVPDFYRGRALPSPHSEVAATAIVNTGGNEERLTYLWEVNGQSVGGGAQLDNRVEFQTPLGRSLTLTVEARDASGNTVAREGVSLPIEQPEVIFYEVNALKGTVEIPIGDRLQLAGSETTVRAQPYYLDNRIFTSNALIEWELNNEEIAYDPVNPLDVAVVRNFSTGNNARLQFQIRNLDDLMQGASGGLSISY